MGEQMASRQLTHLAGADQVHMLSLQGSENLLGQFYRHRCHRHSRGTYGSLRAHSFGDGESSRKKQVQLRVHNANRARCGVCFFHLSQNLGLTDDHRIQA